MAQPERLPRQAANASRSLSSPTADRGGESSNPISPLSEDDAGAPHKKSVLSIVKEKAKKLRHSLSKKKHDDGNLTLTCGPPLEDDDQGEEDAEFLGAPMYESELAPEAYRENARQHPRAAPVIADNHVLHNPLKSRAAMDHQHRHHLAAAMGSLGSNKTMSGHEAEKLTLTYTKGSPDAGLTSISSKMQGLTVTQTPSVTSAPSRESPLPMTTTTAPQTPPAKTSSKLLSPRFSSASSTPRKSSPTTSATVNMKNDAALDQTWDKGVSVREYFKSKLEPGEDEKALSQVISEAMSPRRTPGDVGVMEKVREAVTSLLRNEEPSQDSIRSPTARISSSSQNPVVSSSSVQQVIEEENEGRILQTN